MHDGVHFAIENTFEALGKAYVVARLLEPGREFAVAEGCRLGGLPVEPWLEQPRVVHTADEQRVVFSFCLREPGDRASLRVGDEVSLRGPGLPPRTGAVLYDRDESVS